MRNFYFYESWFNRKLLYYSRHRSRRYIYKSLLTISTMKCTTPREYISGVCPDVKAVSAPTMWMAVEEEQSSRGDPPPRDAGRCRIHCWLAEDGDRSVWPKYGLVGRRPMCRVPRTSLVHEQRPSPNLYLYFSSEPNRRSNTRRADINFQSR